VAWLIWHSARCEDITMNRLISGGPQVLLNEGWLERMQVPARDTGNAMQAAEVAQFSAAINVGALRGYRAAVGRQTRQIVQQLGPQDLKQPVSPTRLQQALGGRASNPAVSDCWRERLRAAAGAIPATAWCT
jgi:hypothetical protein